MFRTAAILLFCVFLPVNAAAQADPQEAQKFIKSLGDRAVEILRNQDVSLDQREAELRGVIAESFDVQTIGRFVLGNTWKTASEAQRKQYLSLYQTYTVQTYTQRLGGYSGQTLIIKDATARNETQVLVDTVIEQEGGEPIPIRWLVRSTDKGMRILDVVIDGKSLARAQNREFAAIVAKQKLDGLIQLMQLQISKFSAES